MFSKIIVAVDGSEMSHLGAAYAASLSEKYGSSVTLIHVVQNPAFPFVVAGMSLEERDRLQQELRETGKSFVNLCQRPLADAGIPSDTDIREGRPAEEIVKAVDEGGFDLLIIGSRGQSKLGGVFLGSVTHEVVRAAKCPVLVVRDDHE